MIIFLFMNFIVVLSSFLITYGIIGLTDSIDSLICWFMFYFGQIIITELLLGIFGALNLVNLISLNLIILLIILYITKNKGHGLSFASIKNLSTGLLNNKVLLFVTAIILGFAVVKIFVNLINPPFGWDNLNYHFTFPVEWLKQGNLDNPIVVSDDPFPTYYPINGSLLFLWYIFPFKSAFFADIAQLPFFIISLLALVSIARKLKLPDEYSILAACLFVFIPNFFKQLQIAYIDIIVAGIFFVSLNFLMLIKEKICLKNVSLFALSSGILVGTKTTMLPYVFFIFLPFLCIVLFNKEHTFQSKVRNIFLFACITFVFGAFSYLRNFVLTGNPFYPLDVNLLGRPIFKGVIEKATFIAREPESGYRLSKLLFHEGLGIQSLLIILPGVLLAPFVYFFKNKKKDLFLIYLTLLPLILYFVYRFILPIPNSRYLYCMLGIAMVTSFFAIYSLKIPLKIIRIVAVVAILASAAECARKMELVVSFVSGFLLFIFFIFLLKYKDLKRFFLSKAFIITATLILIVIMQFLSLDYQKNEYTRYIKNSRYWPDATKAWAWLNENTKKDNIAYVGRPVPYPLYGTNFKNNVYYVSVNSIDPIHLHDLKNSLYRWDDNALNMHRSFEDPVNYRGNADFQTWLNNLKRLRTDFLFIYSLHHTKQVEFPIEELWAKNHPGIFKLEFSNETVKVYKLI